MNIAAINRLRFFNSPTGLYVFTTFTFTPAGATGVNGPTAGQFSTAYSGQSFFPTYFTSSAGIQSWTVPMTGNYQIEARGAQGGGSHGIYTGGLGAGIKGTVSLIQGQVLKMLVGQLGETWVGSKAGGGGGGTYVTDNLNNPIMIAGGGSGGGGNSSPGNGKPGLTGTAGGNADSGGLGGTAGAGGSGTIGAAGGAGLSGNGGTTSCTGTVPLSFINGGTGGAAGTCAASGGDGGFGGGSGGEWCCYGAAGAGGGYSGGGGSINTGLSGGGGSYNAGTNQTNTAGVNTGNGYVIITKV